MVKEPWLPDIVQGVVAKVSTATQADSSLNFRTFFDKGDWAQAGRDVTANPFGDADVLAWLIMPFAIMRGRIDIFGEAKFSVMLMCKTQNSYTQQQRDDLSYKAKLLPVYEIFMREVAKEKQFRFTGPQAIKHRQIIRSYWGAGDINGGGDIPNLFKINVDTLMIDGLETQVKNLICAPSFPVRN